MDGWINTRAYGKLAPIAFGLLSELTEIERNMVIERIQESINKRRETGCNPGGSQRQIMKRKFWLYVYEIKVVLIGP